MTSCRATSPQAAGPDLADAPAQAPLDRSSRLRFLLIEDSPTDSELVRGLLEDEFPHGDVDVASSLRLALVRLADTCYDVILADLTLPDAEGPEVVRAVRSACPQTALMVLTGRADGTLALWTLAEGAQDYFVKGEHDGPRLAEALLRGLQRSRSAQVAHARLVAALTMESEAAAQMRALDTAKDDFVATASHELRTPLTSVVAYIEMLQDEGGLNPRQARFVASIARNANRLAALADDLLLLSSFDAPRPPVETREVDLRTVVTSAAEVTEILGTEKHLEVSLDLPEQPVPVTGDAGQLERVVVNLVSNAIKFTDEGGTVSCRLSASGPEALLTVTDSGIGIRPGEQEELFTRFFRGSAARDGAVQGTGLGLHIVSSIVSAHGGDVSVDSVPGQGSSFTVRLPLLLGGRGRVDPGIAPIRTATSATLTARFIALLSLPPDDTEVRDIAGMLDAALESARQTDQWALLADALRFAHDRLEVRGLTDADLGDVGTAFVDAAGSSPGVGRDRLREVLARCVAEPVDLIGEGSAGLGPSAAAYLGHLLRGDRLEAVDLARRCVTDGMDASEILLDVLEPVQREVGRRWARGQISMVQEHFCTAVTQFVMSDLFAGPLEGEAGRADGAGRRRLVAVHAPGSLHHVGLRMVADVLECRGWDTTYVSDSVTGDALTTLLTQVEADLLLISASMPGQIRHVSAMIRAVRQDARTRAVKVVVGGRPFRVAPDLVDAVGADGWAFDARTAIGACDELVGGVSA